MSIELSFLVLSLSPSSQAIRFLLWLLAFPTIFQMVHHWGLVEPVYIQMHF
jgi:hypothetical protein